LTAAAPKLNNTCALSNEWAATVFLDVASTDAGGLLLPGGRWHQQGSNSPHHLRARTSTAPTPLVSRLALQQLDLVTGKRTHTVQLQTLVQAMCPPWPRAHSLCCGHQNSSCLGALFRSSRPLIINEADRESEKMRKRGGNRGGSFQTRRSKAAAVPCSASKISQTSKLSPGLAAHSRARQAAVTSPPHSSRWALCRASRSSLGERQCWRAPASGATMAERTASFRA
jgi:hypothetical protein